MKYLGVLMLCISFLALKIYSKDKDEWLTHVQKLNEKNVEDDGICEIRDNLLEKFNDIKTQLATVRSEMQVEMRKDTPDWDKIKQMNSDQFRLQNLLTEQISEYKETMQRLHGESQLEQINIEEK